MINAQTRKNSSMSKNQQTGQNGTQEPRIAEDERAHGIDKTFRLPDAASLTFWGRFQNQLITHLLITPTFGCSMICLLFVAAILGSFGGIAITFTSKLNNAYIRYDDTCGIKPVCNVTFTLDHDLVNPKVYYRLENFYANHRNFVKSRNYKQLRGEQSSDLDLISSCSPILTNKDLIEDTGGRI